MSKLDTISRLKETKAKVDQLRADVLAPRPGAQTTFKSAYSPRERLLTVNEAPSLTKQNHRLECDINHIVAKYVKTGVLEHQKEKQGQYVDVSSGADYQTSMNIVATAQSLFADLPSQIRTQFENDPAQFLDFVQNPENEQEMVELGLAKSREKIEPAAPKPVDTAESLEDGAKAPSDKA
jgi:phage internal scaffolding protein